MTLAALLLQLKRLVCYFLGHRNIQERQGDYLYTGCARCRQLSTVDRLKFTRKRETTFREFEDKMKAQPPEGYEFVECNWKKRKAKFVSPSGVLKFVSF